MECWLEGKIWESSRRFVIGFLSCRVVIVMLTSASAMELMTIMVDVQGDDRLKSLVRDGIETGTTALYT
jgi:hypothetical protein